MTTGTDGGGITFVAHRDDEKGVAAIEKLNLRGYTTQLIQALDSPNMPYVAVFGLETTDVGAVGKGGYYLRTASHRLTAVVPNWALETPFRIGIFRTVDRGTSKNGTRSTFASAIAEAARVFSRWSPGIMDWPAPWTKTKSETPAPEHTDQFENWLDFALQAVGSGDVMSILRATLPLPIYVHSESPTTAKLLFLGCATSNHPHTDVAEEIPQEKLDVVIHFCNRLLANLEGKISSVMFSAVSADFLRHPMLRDSLHPFYFKSISEIEIRLGKVFQNGKLRLWNWNHQRSEHELAAALKHGEKLIQLGLVEPVAAKATVPVSSANWLDIIPTEILDWAWEQAHSLKGLEALYDDKVKVQASWAILDEFDHDYGLSRLRANAGIYLALARFLKENPETIIVDFEVYPFYWTYLAEYVKAIWQGSTYSVMPVPGKVRQPWTY